MFTVILSGHKFSPRGELAYSVETADDEIDALFIALAYAASDPEDFTGTVTARIARTTKYRISAR